MTIGYHCFHQPSSWLRLNEPQLTQGKLVNKQELLFTWNLFDRFLSILVCLFVFYVALISIIFGILTKSNSCHGNRICALASYTCFRPKLIQFCLHSTVSSFFLLNEGDHRTLLATKNKSQTFSQLFHYNHSSLDFTSLATCHFCRFTNHLPFVSELRLHMLLVQLCPHILTVSLIQRCWCSSLSAASGATF